MGASQDPNDVPGVSGPVTNAICWLFLLLALLTITGRLITRIKITNFFGLDDIFIIASFIILTILTVLSSIAVSAGLGSHYDDLTEHGKIRAQKWVLVIRAFSTWPLAVPKLSVVALLVRVFEPRRWVAVTFYTLSGLGIVFAGVVSIVWVVQCSPIQKQFDSSVAGSCWAPSVVYALAEVQFIQSVIYDFLFALYPITILLNLKMNRQRKIGVCINMALGMIAGVVGIVKVALINNIKAISAKDPTYVESQVTVEIAIEASLLIIAACVPTSGLALVRIKTMITGSKSFSSRKMYYGDDGNCEAHVNGNIRGPDKVDSEYGEGIPMTARAAPFSMQKSLPDPPQEGTRDLYEEKWVAFAI